MCGIGPQPRPRRYCKCRWPRRGTYRITARPQFRVKLAACDGRAAAAARSVAPEIVFGRGRALSGAAPQSPCGRVRAPASPRQPPQRRTDTYPGERDELTGARVYVARISVATGPRAASARCPRAGRRALVVVDQNIHARYRCNYDVRRPGGRCGGAGGVQGCGLSGRSLHTVVPRPSSPSPNTTFRRMLVRSAQYATPLEPLEYRVGNPCRGGEGATGRGEVCYGGVRKRPVARVTAALRRGQVVERRAARRGCRQSPLVGAFSQPEGLLAIESGVRGGSPAGGTERGEMGREAVSRGGLSWRPTADR
ncbi:hypothetical protein ACJJTC_014900 [Scirpophaga incertulas]